MVVVADLWHSRYNNPTDNPALVGADTINVLPQSPSTPLNLQIVQLLYPIGGSASPFVLRQMYDLLTANGRPGNRNEEPYNPALRFQIRSRILNLVTVSLHSSFRFNELP